MVLQPTEQYLEGVDGRREGLVYDGVQFEEADLRAHKLVVLQSEALQLPPHGQPRQEAGLGVLKPVPANHGPLFNPQGDRL